jgi:hypothetical protein
MLKPHFKIPVHSSDSSPEDRVRTVIATFADDPNYRGFDTEGLQTVKCVAASPETKTVAFEMTITPILCNKNRVLHGGAAAAMLLDMLTSTILGMLSKPGYLDKGPCQSHPDDDISASGPHGRESQGGMPRCCYRQEHGELKRSHQDNGRKSMRDVRARQGRFPRIKAMKTRHDWFDRGRAFYKSECSFGTPCAFLIRSPKKIKKRGKSSVKALIAPNNPNPPVKPILSAIGKP